MYLPFFRHHSADIIVWVFRRINICRTLLPGLNEGLKLSLWGLRAYEEAHGWGSWVPQGRTSCMEIVYVVGSGSRWEVAMDNILLHIVRVVCRARFNKAIV